jgi:hypothetical protein
MHSLPAGATQLWFIVKATVAFSPVLAIWAAGVISWFLRCALWRHSGVTPESGRHARDELAEAPRSSHSPTAAIKAR